MIFNRANEPVSVFQSDGEYDEYGVKGGYDFYGNADMYITLYSQKNTEDARYKDVTHIGYTSCNDIRDNMTIQTAAGQRYKVLLANHYARRSVIFLQEVRQ